MCIKLAVISLLLATPGLVLASAAEDLLVYATHSSSGSAAIGQKTFYTKRFDIAIGNTSLMNINLGELCIRAYSSDGKFFSLDTSSEDFSGEIDSGDLITGFAVFSSEDESIYNASVIKISNSCT